MDTDRLWQTVLARDGNADGLFVYAVTSTGVFCRPSCGSRRPRRDRVRFFPSPAMASAGGFRPCRRCRPEAPRTTAPATARVRLACEAIARAPGRSWTPARLTAITGASATALQRAFQRTLGLTPRDYAAACRRRHFLETLRHGRSVTEAIYDAGYGSSSRIYDARTLPAMTPATYRRGGAGARIDWATTASRVGRILVAATPRGLCFVGIGETERGLRDALAHEFPRAEIATRPSTTVGPLARAARDLAESSAVPADLPLDIAGTAFQWRVWRALAAIPRGQTRTYADIAKAIGRPTAARAVARACATNPVALAVPCHRVVPAAGTGGGYRWGVTVKQQLLAAELNGKS
jgi:AraC family transcriptional regulator, regulatory protein of adaptative response / methylated-DNA-[protein]-cysteine methyltransferase